MEYFHEKVYAVSDNKNFLLDIYSVGKKVHEEINCVKECECLKLLNELDNIIEKMETQELNAAERLKFIELAARHVSLFIIFDQINKKFGAEIYSIDQYCLETAIFFEVQKVKNYLNNVKKIEKLESHNLILPKPFL